MKKSMFVMVMALALAMSTMAGALAAGHTGITSPSGDDIIVADVLKLRAFEDRGASDAQVAWAVRTYDGLDCRGGDELAGWDPEAPEFLDEGYFAVDLNVSQWARGEYCFAFNPAPFNTYRDYVVFNLATPDSKDACKDGGWMTFGDYKNQGQCVSEFARMKS